MKIVRQKKKDRYQRIIAEVFVGQTNVNKEIVRAGYAWHFKKYSSGKEYDKIETEARENKRGLWQDKNPIAPWTWRDIKKQKRALEKSTPFRLYIKKIISFRLIRLLCSLYARF